MVLVRIVANSNNPIPASISVCHRAGVRGSRSASSHESRKKQEGRFENRQPAESPEKRAGREQRDGQQGHPALGLGSNDAIREQKIESEENQSEAAVRSQAHSGEMKDTGQQQGPNRQRHGGIEVAVQIPMPGERSGGSQHCHTSPHRCISRSPSTASGWENRRAGAGNEGKTAPPVPASTARTATGAAAANRRTGRDGSVGAAREQGRAAPWARLRHHRPPVTDLASGS